MLKFLGRGLECLVSLSFYLPDDVVGQARDLRSIDSMFLFLIRCLTLFVAYRMVMVGICRPNTICRLSLLVNYFPPSTTISRMQMRISAA
jgi:hypothetical protein